MKGVDLNLNRLGSPFRPLWWCQNFVKPLNMTSQTIFGETTNHEVPVFLYGGPLHLYVIRSFRWCAPACLRVWLSSTPQVFGGSSSGARWDGGSRICGQNRAYRIPWKVWKIKNKYVCIDCGLGCILKGFTRFFTAARVEWRNIIPARFD